MNRNSKTLIVLLPGALLGAGVGALVAAFQLHPASPAVLPLETAGVILALGSILLRIGLSQAGLSLSAFAGLISNGACTFLSGAAVVLILRWMTLAAGDEPVVRLLAVVALGWIPCLALAFLGLVISAPWRAKPAAQKKD